MGRVCLACFHQLLLREKPLSTFTNVDEAVRILALLVHDIQKLEASITTENFLSLQWCTDVVNLLRKLHFHLLCFVQSCKPTMSPVGVNCMEEYMKESLILLDFCNSLKSAISDMNRYCLVMDIAAEKLSNASSKHEIERLERESKKFYGTEKGKDLNLSNQGMSKPKSKDFNVHFVYAVRGTIRTLSLLLFSTICHPVSTKPDDGLYSNIPQLKFFSVAVKNLICSFSEGLDIQGINKNNTWANPVLHENKKAEGIVFQIKDLQQASRMQVGFDQEKYMMSIDSLKNNSKCLKEGLAMFESVVSELFEEVIKGRNKLLAMIT